MRRRDGSCSGGLECVIWENSALRDSMHVMRNDPGHGGVCMARVMQVDLNLYTSGALFTIPPHQRCTMWWQRRALHRTQLGFGDEPCLCDLQLLYILSYSFCARSVSCKVCSASPLASAASANPSSFSEHSEATSSSDVSFVRDPLSRIVRSDSRSATIVRRSLVVSSLARFVKRCLQRLAFFTSLASLFSHPEPPLLSTQQLVDLRGHLPRLRLACCS